MSLPLKQHVAMLKARSSTGELTSWCVLELLMPNSTIDARPTPNNSPTFPICTLLVAENRGRRQVEHWNTARVWKCL
ncbi:hypothetical protein BDZ85DRAFT_258944 [Elsinoe ampelina]|uniref:Uncharacterized protein n=1 Tax=Elsinoe ampelina TaxID=302913 RepID=A0A6A6GGA6_9PEZI|nr:hypothetical protein BDZ85DRAFT_258944 [Elsinoe ampelina]